MSSEDNTNCSQETTLVENYLEIASDRKQDGNNHFRAGKWDEALVAYRSALNCLPKRSLSANEVNPLPSEEDGEAGEKQNSDAPKAEEDVVDISSPAVSETDKEAARLRAVLNANIGACFVKLGDHKEAVKSCTEAIHDDPTYVKARERRAASNDVLNTWTSLTSVQEDYDALLKLINSPSQQSDIKRKLQLLKPRLEAAQKRETDEMLGKLKGLGNSILGNFGLSTDNFKFEPNGAGGYSMNFTR
ncbi:hypothetical protein CVT25_012355 [Psilocybe cyanescens]|uniref:Tetratricopeptide repeat protein 1 n=1 Tax=Psilocybe cyanescens TaxID=93625 RepID=A0A409XFT7_PSICY|nr:hypothetical protein CVT25_012355 [Psilocybe cyanescens]